MPVILLNYSSSTCCAKNITAAGRKKIKLFIFYLLCKKTSLHQQKLNIENCSVPESVLLYYSYSHILLSLSWPCLLCRYIMRYRTISCDIMRYRTISCDIMRYLTISCDIMRYRMMYPYRMISHDVSCNIT